MVTAYHHKEQRRRWFWCRVCKDWRKSEKGLCPVCKGPDAAFWHPTDEPPNEHPRNTTPY